MILRCKVAVFILIQMVLVSSAWAGPLLSGVNGYLQEKGVQLEAVYTAEYFANTKGGLKRDDTVLTNFDITLEVDTSAAGLWDNGKLFTYVLVNSGKDKLSGEIIGDLQAVSNIEAPRTARLYEVWYEHSFMEEEFSILLGIHDYNSEFNVTEFGGLFLNSSFGIQPDISGGSRPSVFPLAAPAVRLKWAADEDWDVLLGVYDGDPGDPDVSEHFPRSDIDSEGGAFIAGEAAYRFGRNYLQGTVKLGIWNNTGDFTDISGAAVDDNNTGGYLLVDKKIFTEENHEEGLGAFLQFGVNDKDINEIQLYAGGGLHYKGLIAGRSGDQTGLAVGYARMNERLTGARENYEMVIEATYKAQISESLSVQPDFQYIINPGAAAGVDNAFAAGVRIEFIL